MIVANVHHLNIDSIRGKDRILGQDIVKFSSSQSKNWLIDTDTNSTKGANYILPSVPPPILKSYDLCLTPTVGFLFDHMTPRHVRSFKLSREIDDIYSECSRKNWDGYGAKPLIKSLRKDAEKFLDALPDHMPDPEISPDPDGEISLEWYHARNKMFSISIGRKGRIAYAVLDGKRRTSGIEMFENKIPESIIFQLNNFLSKK